MTRKKLESVYWLKKELLICEERLSELQADIALSPKVLDGMPYSKTNSTSNPTEEKGIKLAEESKRVRNKITEIIKTLSEIERYIEGIDDIEIRLIIELRCIQCKTWADIGNIMGYDRTTAAKKYISFVNEKFPTFPTP